MPKHDNPSEQVCLELTLKAFFARIGQIQGYVN